MDTNQKSVPNLRLNAFRLGISLLVAAANPYSGLTAQASRKGSWQPEHPFGLPRWWPWAPTSGRLVDLPQLELMQSALYTHNKPSGAKHARKSKPQQRPRA